MSNEAKLVSSSLYLVSKSNEKISTAKGELLLRVITFSSPSLKGMMGPRSIMGMSHFNIAPKPSPTTVRILAFWLLLSTLRVNS